MTVNQSERAAQSVDEGSRLPRSLLTYFLTLAVAGSLFTYSSVSDTVHLGITVPAVMLFGVLAVYRNSSLRVSRYALLAYVAIWLIYVPHALAPSLDTWALIRLPAFISGSFILLFVVPNVISLEQFLRTVFYVAAGVTLLGLPVLLVGSYDIAGLVFSPYAFPGTIPIVGVMIRPFSSFLVNPNPYGFIAGLGALAGLGVCASSRRGINIGLLTLVVLGLYLSLSRASLLGWGIGASLFVAYRYAGRYFVVVLVGGGLTLGGYMVAALIGVVPDVLGVGELFLYDRLDFWTAAIRALDGHELFGIGFGGRAEANVPLNLHNGYVFVLLTRGLVGFAAHIALLGLAYRQCLCDLRNATTAALFAMLTMILTVTFFESIILFGFGGLKVLATLVVGYSVQPRPVRDGPSDH